MHDDAVLLIDDEVSVLHGLKRLFAGDINIQTAASGEEAIARIDTGERFAVVICDQRMKGMDGIETLTAIREKSATTTRILLTGFADSHILRGAVNKAGVFRVLDKPCKRAVLEGTIFDALAEYKIISAQVRGIEKTVLGTIKMLREIQNAFGIVPGRHRGAVMDLARTMVRDLKCGPIWEMDAALMLADLDGLQSYAEQADPRPAHERENLSTSVLAHIPRLRRVSEALSFKWKNYDGSGKPANLIAGAAIPPLARVLRVVLEYERLLNHGFPAPAALKEIVDAQSKYDPAVVRKLVELSPETVSDLLGEPDQVDVADDSAGVSSDPEKLR